MNRKIYTLVVLLLIGITKTYAQTWNQVGSYILGQNAEDYLGLEDEVAINSDGSVIAVASAKHDNYKGQVRVFKNVSGQWIQMGNSINGDTNSDNFGDAIALSANGLIIAIGAPNHAGNGSYSGQVKVFEFNQTTSSWSQLGNDIYGDSVDNFCGSSVDLSKDGLTLATSSPYNDNAFNNAGEVRVFHYNGTNWTQVGNSIYGQNANEKIYYSRLNGDGTVVATGSNNNAGHSGFVRVYKLVSNTWTLQGNEIVGEAAGDYASNPVLNDSGLTLAVGAYGNDNGGSDAGNVRVFNFDGTNWTKVGSDINGEAAGDWFGSALSLSSNGLVIAIGAYANDDGGNMAGEVKVFEYDSTNWVQVGNDIDGTADNDGLGQSLAISGNGQNIIIGIPRKDDNGYNSGAAVVYHTDSIINGIPNPLQNAISVFPNPTNGKFIIYNESAIYRAEIIDIKGEKIMDLKISSPNTEIDLSNKAPGIYFVKILDREGNTKVIKLIKK